jgi:hypothetical protein
MRRARRPLTAWRRTAVSVCAAALLAPLPAAADTCSALAFGTTVSGTTGTLPATVLVGDFNRDGKLDVLTVNQGANQVGVLPGNGAGILGASVGSGAGTAPIDAVVGDFDRDVSALLDVVVANQGSTSVSLLSGQAVPAYSFGAATQLNTGIPVTRLAVGDFNRDGRPDLVVIDDEVSGTAQDRIRVMPGTGTTAFFGTTPTADLLLTAGSNPSAAAVGDFNRDGNLDLAVTVKALNQVWIYLGDGTGKLGDGTGPPPNPTPFATVGVGSAPVSLAVGDVNHDGKLDLVVANSGSTFATVLLGLGNGGFSAAAPTPAVGLLSRVLLADLDRDGALDLVGLDQTALTPRVVALRGNPAAATIFDLPVYAAGLTASSSPVGLAAGDFNSDGRTDLVTALAATNAAVLVPNSSGSTCGQTSFSLAPRSYEAGKDPVAAAVADLDEDGRRDLVVADNAGQTLQLLKGAPSGLVRVQSAPWPIALPATPRGVAAGDFDADGHLDVVVAMGGQVRLYKGDGTGGLAASSTQSAGTNLSGVVVADFNGDGKPDAAATDEGANKVYVFLGDGAGGLGAGLATTVGTGPRALAAADVNGDGLTDLAVAVAGGSANVWVLKGLGDGTFSSFGTLTVGTDPWGIVASDLDADGKVDLATADHGSSRVSVLKGGGDGTFGAATPYTVGMFPTGLALVDVAGSARPDIAVSTASVGGSPAAYLLVDNGVGLSGYLGATAHPVRTSPQTVVPLDVDADGRPDLVLPCRNSGAVVVLVARPPGPPIFSAAPNVAVGPQPVKAVVADFDRDGDLDLAVANSGAATVTVLANDGAGGLSLSSTPTVGTGPLDIVTADFDRDGVPDLATASATTNSVSILRGLPGGGFASAITVSGISTASCLAVGDFDRDGDVDLAVCNKVASGTVTILQNQTLAGGPITFAALLPTSTFAAGNLPAAIFVADLNRDGIPDLAITNSVSADVTVRFGDGTGAFPTSATLSLAPDVSPVSVTGGDLDLDGDVDLVVAAYGSGLVDVLPNNGSGTFGPPIRLSAPDLPQLVTVADLNRDGKPDIAVAATGLKALRGKGSLLVSPPFQEPEGWVARYTPYALVVADFNRDGSPDVAVVNQASNDVSVLLSSACAPRRLDVSPQPAACGTGPGPFPFTTGVTALDDGGNLAACANGNTVDAAIVPGTGDPTASLSGSTAVALSSGTASFSLSIDKPGKRYRLSFTTSGAVPGTTRRFTLGSDLAITGPTSFCPGSSAVYSAPPGYDSYKWTLTPTPPATPPFTNPLTLDSAKVVPGANTLALTSWIDTCPASDSVGIYVGDLQSVTLSLVSGSATVCVDCIGGTVQPTETGGGAVTARQWGYRLVSGAGQPITDIVGETGPSYVIKGSDFPGPGTYYLVVKTTATCPATTTPSSELPVPITVNEAVPGNDVQHLAASARGTTSGGGSVRLLWVNSTGTADRVRIRWNKAPDGTSNCTAPPDPDFLPVGGEFDVLSPTTTKSYWDHTGLAFNTAYCYALFVEESSVWSAGRVVKARPFNAETAKIKYAYATGGTAVAPPVVGQFGVLVMSNDRTVHALTRGSAGGDWPASFTPRALTGVAHSRSPVVPLVAPVNGASALLFAADDQGDAVAMNAELGTFAWGPVTPSATVTMTGAPGAILQQYGGPADLILIGSRHNNPLTTPSTFFALALSNGATLGTYDGSGTLGPVNGSPAVDYATGRVYFVSRKFGSGSTVWCVQANGTTPYLTPVWSRDLGDMDASPVLRNGRLYVADNLGTVYSLDAASGTGDRTFTTGDGPVRGFVFPDRRNDDLMFATDHKVFSISDDGSLTMPKNWEWTIGGLDPSIVLYWPQTSYVYVGSTNGLLYQLDFSSANLSTPPTYTALVLGDGTGKLGAPSLDIGVSPALLLVGSEQGVVYAVEVPF